MYPVIRKKYFQICLFSVSLLLFPVILYADIFFLSEKAFLVLPYVLIMSVNAFFIGRSAGLFFSVLSVFFLVISRVFLYAHLSFIIYADIMIKSIFIFIQLWLILLIKKLYARVESLSLTDQLTGLYNSRGFEFLAEYEIRANVRRSEIFSTVFMDVDNFKEVNDTKGHPEGDKVLCSLGTAIKESIRKTDIPARLGGDEFSIMLPSTSIERISEIIDRISKRFRDVCIENGWKTTLSIGVISTDKEISVPELIEKTDVLMYKAKSSGKGKIEYDII